MRRALSVLSVARLASVACLLGACAHSTESSDASSPASSATNEPASAEASRAPGRAIGAVVTHDAKVTILSREHGDDLRVVVRRNDGQIVADGIALSELQTRDPLLHAIVKSAVASNGDGTYLDATLDRPAAHDSAGLRGR